MTEMEWCGTCGNTGLATCTNHGAEVDEDGWCTICDSEKAAKVPCECQD